MFRSYSLLDIAISSAAYDVNNFFLKKSYAFKWSFCSLTFCQYWQIFFVIIFVTQPVPQLWAKCNVPTIRKVNRAQWLRHYSLCWIVHLHATMVFTFSEWPLRCSSNCEQVFLLTLIWTIQMGCNVLSTTNMNLNFFTEEMCVAGKTD